MACPGRAPRFCCCDITWQTAPQHYGLDEVLRQIGAAGYTGAELSFAPTELGPIASLESMLSRLGLHLATLVVPTLAPDARERVEYAARLGVEVLMVGGGQRPVGRPVENDDVAPYAEALTALADYAGRYGMRLAQHTHPRNVTGTTEETMMLLAMVPQSVGVTADVAHLRQAGSDPVAAIRRLGDRLLHVHLKDYQAESDELVELGRGDVDVLAVMRTCQELGYTGWYSVELDQSQSTPAQSAAISRDYLRQLGY